MNQELQAHSTPLSQAIQETVLLGGDLSQLAPQERLAYYSNVCASLGLNPLTRPFEYIVLNGKMALYARKDCTEQLRSNKKISVSIVARESVEGTYVVTARATMPDGRADESIGAVSIDGLKGEARANALMKAETKAKRRVTLSIAGLGMLDETEVETIPTAVSVVASTAAPKAEAVLARMKPVTSPEATQEPEPMPANAHTLPPPQPEEVGDLRDEPTDSIPAFIWRVGAKHKNESITTIPIDYLQWFATNGKVPDHIEAAKAEVNRRQGQVSAII